MSDEGVARGVVEFLWRSTSPTVDVERLVAAREAVLMEALRRARLGRNARVLIGHEIPLVCHGVARELERGMLGTSETASSLPEMLQAAGAESCDLVVCSDRLADGIGIGEIARTLRESGAGAPLLVLSRAGGAHSFEAALEAGASGYLRLADARERIVDAAAALLTGQSALHREVVDGDSPPRLTRREREVLLACDRGLSHKQIARELSIAISTTKTHARSLYSKLDATSRTQALYNARRVGLLLET